MPTTSSLAQLIDQLIHQTVQRARTQPAADEPMTPAAEVLAPLTLAELIERLAILHCRLWALEDAVRAPGISEEERGRLARTIFETNANARPTLLKCIDGLFAAACREPDCLPGVPDKIYRTAMGE